MEFEQEVPAEFICKNGRTRAAASNVTDPPPFGYLNGSGLEALANRRLALGFLPNSQLDNFTICLLHVSIVTMESSEQLVENAGGPQSPTTMSAVAGSERWRRATLG
jgi:hypothetical protein